MATTADDLTEIREYLRMVESDLTDDQDLQMLRDSVTTIADYLRGDDLQTAFHFLIATSNLSDATPQRLARARVLIAAYLDANNEEFCNLLWPQIEAGMGEIDRSHPDFAYLDSTRADAIHDEWDAVQLCGLLQHINWVLHDPEACNEDLWEPEHRSPPKFALNWKKYGF